MTSHGVTVTIIQPTITSNGYVEFALDSSSRALFFTATPPPGLWIIQTTFGGQSKTWASDLWFGVVAQ
jgi:hypothetical protein